MAKGQGAILYIDVNSDNTYLDVGCIYNLKPSGMARGVTAGEACLADTSVTDETGDLKYTPMTGTLQAAPTGTAQAEIEAAILADTAIQFAIKHPLSTVIYQLGSGKISTFEYQGFERDTEMKYDIEIVPDAAYTYSTTAPTT